MRQRTFTAGLAALLAGGLALAQQPPKPDKVVATINGVAIMQSELDGVLKAAGPAPVALPEAQKRQRQMEALRMMMEDVLMRQFLEKNTRPVAPAEIDRKLNEMRAALKEQSKTVEEFLQETSQTLDQLKANISDHLRWNAYAAAHVSDAQVEAYYKENKDFFDGVTVRVSHIVIRLPAAATEAEKVKAHATLSRIRQQLLTDPKCDFADMAKQYSQDPMAAKGGDLGYIPRKWFDEAFSKAAFALPVGQVSDVVTTDFGLHLIKVTDRKPGRASEFAKIKEGVREFCSEELRREIISKMYNDVVREGKLKVELP
jgi:peptidyl-prolyl cis-trans isomerase C